jgi:alkanesulfonate monooxygenase SsuD/methylene tetrahydromethanopterin reductase-like flavin-dependent oxidoreductase (luciferase family)
MTSTVAKRLDGSATGWFRSPAMKPVEFGLFDWLDRKSGPVRQLFEDHLQLIQAAEEAGFTRYHLAEHHGTPLGMAPSPSVFLSAVAQRTKAIRLGALVYLLPLYEPLRLAEEICMLDQLSGGRLELGVGRGVSPYEVACFGVDVANSRAMFNEALEIITSFMTKPMLDFAGEHYRYAHVPVEVRPVQTPYPPLWYPTHNPESIDYAAKHGFNFVGLGPTKMLRQQIDHYREVWEKHRHAPGRLNGHVSDPKLGVLRQVVVAETDAEAESIARAAHGGWYRSITKLWHDHDDHSYDALFGWEGSVGSRSIVFGSPARVRETLTSIVEGSNCNYAICAFAWGPITLEQSMRSIALFRDEVMPAFA